MLDLLDYRRQVFELYAGVRARHADRTAWSTWRRVRDDLFASHSQSALDSGQKAAFTGLAYYDYDPRMRVSVSVDTDVEPGMISADVGDDGVVHYRRVGRVQVDLPTGSGTLSVFWIEGYGGGLFIPFGDSTNRQTTYGAGRYLYDTIKGADLGTLNGGLLLDFNYAYNPSCSYNYRWVCPLAPSENRLDFPIPAGEMSYDDGV